MSQPSVASFFHSRKRTAIDDIFATKNKVNVVDGTQQVAAAAAHVRAKLFEDAPSGVLGDSTAATSHQDNVPAAAPTAPATRSGRRTPVTSVAPTAASTRPRRCLKQTSDTTAAAATKRSAASAETAGQPKIVKFTLAGHLSPMKRTQREGAVKACDITSVAMALFGNRESNVDRGQTTPTKADQRARLAAEQIAETRCQLSMDEVKARVTRSTRLSEMKASMDKLKALQAQREQIISTRKSTMKTADKHSISDQQTGRAAMILGKGLKQFDTIELEILSSPQKGLTTPTKQRTVPASPGGGSSTNELMSPKKTVTPRRLFSPTKTATGSPTKCAGGSPSASLPAYQRFQALREAGRPTLTLPYKYRCLAETFKCLDTVCSMFFNRHETITMKKLRPAVQRMLRKNFGETDLGQIMAVYPDAYKFHQKKMLNAGSHTKFDYYQLVVTPNVAAQPAALQAESAANTSSAFGSLALQDGDNILSAGQQKCMNPQVIIERQQKFNQLLLDLVKEQHDAFLRSMEQPFVVPKDKITRWHVQFDLEACTDVQPAALPQPPNVEKFSSARDILSTARNLFNCATPMERIMQRVEDKLTERKKLQAQQPAAAVPQPKKTVAPHLSAATDTESEPPTPTQETGHTTVGRSASADPVSVLLKGVPKSLLERIRAKQAAKALDAMTRRPSQDKEAVKFERLPDLARHLRNIFVTESRNVLKIECVLAKLENSFRARLTKERMKELLELVAVEVPNQWLSFPHIADVHYVKIKKDVPLSEVIAVLERRAAEMA